MWDMCDKAIEEDDVMAKARFCREEAYSHLNEFKLSKANYEKASQLEPTQQ